MKVTFLLAQKAGEAIEIKQPQTKEFYNWNDDIKNNMLFKHEPASRKTSKVEPTIFTWPMDGLHQSEHVMHNYVDLAGENELLDYMGGIGQA